MAVKVAGRGVIAGRLGRALRLRSLRHVDEPPIVIEHRQPLLYMLAQAAELEHGLMCEYLFAAFSLKRSVAEGLSDEQAAAADRWRSALLAVAKQEMLHLVTSCSLSGRRGSTSTTPRALPRWSGRSPRTRDRWRRICRSSRPWATCTARSRTASGISA